jgi:serine/threonine protein kinase
MGGMAQVHRAKKRGPAGFERSVALKRMLSHLAEDRSFVESFVREAKVVSLLVHPNIAQIYDFGRIGGIYYIAMELVAGFDLRKLLRYANRANEPIPLPVILSILGEMSEALEYAHTCRDEDGRALNIVHRDISPSNMIIAHTGHLKVIDFGIAKAESRQLHTESGQVKGKLGYMSPESALGMSSGPVSDVFSMGVVAWELVTASPLFSARTDFETMRKIRESEVAPPSRHNPSAPHELDRLILHALERDPERRLPTASAFRKGLEYVAQRYGVQVSARAVAEWIKQFLQPEDLVQSGRTPPPQQTSTSILRPSAKERLQRSHDEIALATEIWGEDALTQDAPPAGPDFSVAEMGGAIPTVSGLMLPNAQNVRFSPGTAPEMLRDLQLTAPGRPGGTQRAHSPNAYPNLPLPAPDRVTPVPQHPSGPMAMPQHGSGPMMVQQHPSGGMAMPGYAQTQTPPQPVRRKGGLAIVAVIAFVAAMVGGVLIIKGTRKGTPQPLAIEMGSAQPAGSQVAMVEPQHDPNDEIKDAAAAAPPVAPDAAAGSDEDVAVEQPGKPTPTHHKRTHTSSPKHVEHAAPADAAVVETPPPPEVKPDAAVAVAVQKPDPAPEPPKPDKPARTAVVPATSVHKLSGALPTIKGDSGGTVTVKMCIDEAGNVSSVKGVGSTPPADLTRALQGWKYQPYKNQEGKVSPACFVQAVQVVVSSSD